MLGPEVDAVDALDFFLKRYAFRNDVPVTEPGGFLMKVVRGFARLPFFHGPGARQGNTVRSIKRPKEWFGGSRSEVVVSYKLVSDVKREPVFFTGYPDLLVRTTAISL